MQHAFSRVTAGGVDVTDSGDRIPAEPTAATVAWSITAGHPLLDRDRTPIGGAA